MPGEKVSKFIKYNIFFMKLLGLWSDIGNFFEHRHYWKYAFLLNSIAVSFALSQVIYAFTKIRDIETMSSAACVAISCFLATAKGQFCIWFSPTFKDIYDQMNQEILQPKNERQWQQTNRFMRRFIVGEVCFVCTALGTMLPLWFLSPWFDNQRRLPFRAWYPFETDRPVLFEILYAHQVIARTYVSTLHLSLDNLAMACIAIIGVQCDILADTMKNVDEFTTRRLENEGKPYGESEWFMGLNQTLVECVHHHRKILKFYDTVNKTFTMLIFSQFAISLISLCMTALQLTVLPTTSMIFYATVNYQLLIFIQLGLYCWYGNEILEKSSNIAGTAYECPWMDYPESFKKNLLFFMVRVQKPMIIYAFNFFELTLPTLKGILKTAWSVFTMLNQMNLKKDAQRG